MEHPATGIAEETGTASQKTPGRLERLEVRLRAEQKALLKRAAALEGRTLTDFVVQSAQAAALATIQRHEVIKLTACDSLIFAEALIHPPVPNDRLRAAARCHRDVIADNSQSI